MDSATYDSTDNLIIAVRGGRVFSCDPVTGAINGHADYQQLGLGAASIVWDSGSNKCFAVCWNTGNFNTPAFGGTRKIYRIVPANIVSDPTNAVDLVSDFVTTFGTTLGAADLEGGIAALRSVSGVIYGVGWNSSIHPAWCVFRFTAPNLSSPSFHQAGVSGPTPSCAYARVSGTNDVLFWGSQNGDNVESWDFTASAFNSSAFNSTRGYVAVEYAPVQGNLYVTRQFQFIDQYTGVQTPVYVATINTGRVAFNGVNIRYNFNDGLVYVAGGADNTVAVIDPATNAVTIKTGFDLPFDFVFTPTHKFVVQQGATGLLAFT